jgi:hypothetical protein
MLENNVQHSQIHLSNVTIRVVELMTLFDNDLSYKIIRKYFFLIKNYFTQVDQVQYYNQQVIENIEDFEYNLLW